MQLNSESKFIQDWIATPRQYRNLKEGE